MRNILYIIILSFTIACITACENKHGRNGDLDGNWQLTSWIDNADGTIKRTNADGLYYCVNLNLIKIWYPDSGSYYLATFKHHTDSLYLNKIYKSPFDSIADIGELANYGVDATGKFKICKLNSKDMILTNSTSTLTFRRY